MARKVPDRCPDAPKRAFEASRKWTGRIYSISLVTPLFGGGPIPGENDPVTLIRGSSIRGHLRFWWRATRGASFESVESLRRREGEIWGTAESPSPVMLLVSELTKGEAGPWAKYEADPKGGGVRSIPTPVNSSYPSYALFPFQGKAEKAREIRKVTEYPATVTTGVSFKLTLQWPADMDIAKDIEASVWAWVNFGGLGARTRRGCGSLFCKELAPTAEDTRALQQWYARHLEQYGIQTSQAVRPWPTLPEQPLVRSNQAGGPLLNSVKAWSKSINILQQFRQGLGVGRNRKEDEKPGRSFWPEADSLRRVTKQKDPGHAESITTSENAFPRAEFGLPIVFHFKNEPPRGSKGVSGRDPADGRLLPTGDTERMASPLILKALAVGPNQAIPMILQLKTQLPDGVIVEFDGRAQRFGSDKIRRPDLSSYPHSPMSGRSPNGSALEAFIEFARQEGFR
ncbi:MAG: type III-B CRISPR module RAMP protein Cmr1 [Firmicutes bacterium]|nr:type III-B CRISPR module RAMP protein Cmr1 [Bacillota bacterium]